MTFRRTRCPSCRGKLEQGQRIHIFCIDAYAESEAAKAQRKAEKQARMAARVERVETRRKLEATKSINELTKEAQKEFNAFIRERDSNQPCISCGRLLGVGDIGGGFDCGHYRSTGAAKHLRFHPDNAHGQCKQCNRWLAGRATDYRIGLLARIGASRVESLEANNAIHKWTKDELRAIKAEYREKLKRIKSSFTAVKEQIKGN